MKVEDLVVGKEYEIAGDTLKFISFDDDGSALFECNHSHGWSSNEDGCIPFSRNGGCMESLKEIIP